LSTIQNLIDRSLDVDFASTRSADAQRFIQHAIGKIYRKTALARGDYATPIATAVGVPSTSTAALDRAVKVATIIDDLGNPLDAARPVRRDAAPEATAGSRGRPSSFAIGGLGDGSEPVGVLWWPIPDRIYTFTLMGRFEPPIADLDVTDRGAAAVRLRDLPVYYARAELFDLEDDDAGTARWRNKWTAGLRELAGDLNVRVDLNRRVPGTWAGTSAGGPQFHRAGLF
jgi:hypothetical protein